MSEDLTRTGGTSKAYKPDAGGAPVDPGPHIGIVKNTSDSARTGKIQVFIRLYGGPNEQDSRYWKDVSYISPFYGHTTPPSPKEGTGSFVQNKHSYGMWFTPPDVGTEVICVFVNGDPNQGYYFGSVVNHDAHHMVPAIGARTNYVRGETPNPYYAESTQLPVVELNDANEELADSGRFFDSTRPVHDSVAGVLLDQGLINDTVRGSIGSNSYRETPSTVYGISTPGRPIYDGGLRTEDLNARLEEDADDPGTLPISQLNIIGRQGGHSIVMDDGDSNGNDQHLRIRTSTGHQIMMSDSGDTLHIIHANGRSWFELGPEGTVDFYAANSFNVRAGQINLHADSGINVNSGLSMNLKSGGVMNIESQQLQLTGEESMLAFSKKFIGLKSDGTLSLQSAKSGTWDAGSSMTLWATSCIDLNGSKAPSVPKTTPAAVNQLPDTKFEANIGWVEQPNAIDTVASRVPTHEPWPFHSQGSNTETNLDANNTSVPLTPEVQEKVNGAQTQEILAIDNDDFVSQTPTEKTVGILKPDVVTGMLAQANKEVAQGADAVSNALGVGKYGLSAEQLEATGYLKQGITELYKTELQTDATSILQSPGCWSGKNDVTTITDFLSDPKLQDDTKVELFQKGLKDLQSNGIISGAESVRNVAGLVQASAKEPIANIKKWINNQPLDTSITSEIQKQVKGGQYASEFTETIVSSANKGYSTATTNTVGGVTQTEVNQAVRTTNTTTKTDPVVKSTKRELVETGDPVLIAKLESQITAIKNQIRQAAQDYRAQNPGSTIRDWLDSSTYQSLSAKQERLESELDRARTYKYVVTTT